MAARVIKYLKIPKIHSGAVQVWKRNYLHFRKTWLVSFFWIIFEPLFYLGSIGLGLGTYINTMDGVAYIDFFFPGLLCTTAMLVAFFENTYTSYAKLTIQDTYSTMLLTTLTTNEIAIGEIAWGATKSLIGALGVTFIASLFGLVQNFYIFPALILVAILGWLFSALALIVTTYAKSFDSFIYAISGFIIPMSLLSGTYFPVESMPGFFRLLAYLFPLYHGVNAARSLVLESFTWISVVNILFLILLAWIATAFAIRRLSYRLIK